MSRGLEEQKEGLRKLTRGRDAWQRKQQGWLWCLT